MSKAKFIVISAPSGSGKSTIINEIIKDETLKLEFSVSATTRPPRGDEVDGVDYYYLTVDEFKNAIERDELIEYEEVYPGRFYGTLKREIERINEAGRNPILDLDVKGGVNVKKIYGERCTSIFIQAPSVEVLRTRLENRATDSPEEIEKRVDKAAFEMSFADRFDYCVVNDNLQEAVANVHNIIDKFIS